MAVEKIKFMLMAEDMDRALKFHTDVFGFVRGFRSDHWSELMHGDTVIAFHGGGNGSPNPTGLSIQVDDAHATAAAIEAAGGTIIDTPYQREGEPIKLGTFRDREGNEIMLTEWVG
jgi:lactoylglutathione lyase